MISISIFTLVRARETLFSVHFQLTSRYNRQNFQYVRTMLIEFFAVASLFVARMYKKLERFWISIFTRIRAREKRVFCLFRLISN